jgi:hypothetical protein
MVKNEHQLQSMPWETHHHHQQQQQLDYYMNVPATSCTNVNFIINNTNNTNRINCNGNSSSPSSEFGSTTMPQHKEIYPWMSDKKHGTNKSKNTAKNHAGHNTTSTSSSSSSSGKIVFKIAKMRVLRIFKGQRLFVFSK